MKGIYEGRNLEAIYVFTFNKNSGIFQSVATFGSKEFEFTPAAAGDYYFRIKEKVYLAHN
jgi:hypothetical protein